VVGALLGDAWPDPELIAQVTKMLQEGSVRVKLCFAVPDKSNIYKRVSHTPALGVCHATDKSGSRSGSMLPLQCPLFLRQEDTLMCSNSGLLTFSQLTPLSNKLTKELEGVIVVATDVTGMSKHPHPLCRLGHLTVSAIIQIS